MAVLQPEPLITTPTLDDVLFLALNLRQTDREETIGTLLLDPADEAEHLAEFVFQAARAALACELYADPQSGRPFALAFISRATQTSAQFNFICTEEVRRHFRWITAEVRRRLPSVMEAHALDRIECRARGLASHVRWLQSIGARFECAVPGFSRHGFVQLAWVRGSDHVLIQ